MNERPSRWSPAAPSVDDSLGELANARCALCGIELSIISLVPDGGPASAEVRWYCRDIVSCTERWTADRAQRAGQAPAPDGNAPDPGAEPVPGEQAAPSGDRAPVAGDAPEPAEELVPEELMPTEVLVPVEEPGPGREPTSDEGPRRGKVRAGQSVGRGRRGTD